MTKPDGRLARGDQTRRRILDHAMRVASLDGLEGLSIGRLAGELHVSKTGVFAHFGSKEELQLAVVRAARKVFGDQVIEPAYARAPGLPRLTELCERWLDYSEQRVFPGGCFFFATGAEFDARPGRVRDALAETRREWLALYAQIIRDARQLGQLIAEVDPEQLAFELDALATAANSAALLLDDAAAYTRSRAAIRCRLRAVATDPEQLGALPAPPPARPAEPAAKHPHAPHPHAPHPPYDD